MKKLGHPGLGGKPTSPRGGGIVLRNTEVPRSYMANGGHSKPKGNREGKQNQGAVIWINRVLLRVMASGSRKDGGYVLDRTGGKTGKRGSGLHAGEGETFNRNSMK